MNFNKITETTSNYNNLEKLSSHDILQKINKGTIVANCSNPACAFKFGYNRRKAKSY